MKIATLCALMMASLLWPGMSIGQQAQPAGPTIETINAEYGEGVLRLERTRLIALGKLAMSQSKDQAAMTLDAYFRLAIAKGLYAEAEPTAARVIESGESPNSVSWLAHLVNMVAEADRGAYDESLKNLAIAIHRKGQEAAKGGASLDVGTRAAIVDAYYQRLMHGDQIEVARKAMKLVFDSAEVPAIRDLAGRHLRQLDLVGKPAPSISGLDLDGKAFQLADTKGEVVLVVFWATWCVPNAQEMPWLDYLYRTYHPRGFRVVGINLDSAQDGGQELKTVLPQIRRFLADYHVTWPTLLNGPGEIDYASAFGVTEIPAAVLIGRDGKIRHLDLVGKKLEKAIVEAVGQRKP